MDNKFELQNFLDFSYNELDRLNILKSELEEKIKTVKSGIRDAEERLVEIEKSEDEIEMI